MKFLGKMKDWFMTLSKTMKVFFVVVLVAVVWFGVTFALGNSHSKINYQTAVVTRGSLISSVTESGNVATGSQAGVGSPTTGIITDIYVKDGDTVKAGQNLFKVKSIATAQEIASAWANYQNAVVSENSAEVGKTSAQATLEKDRQAVIDASTAVTNMQNNLNTSQQNPVTKQAYTQNDIDSINSALTSARETFTADQAKYMNVDTAISSAKASENSAWLAYEATQDSVVTAPIAGVVANITVKPNDEVTASSGNLSSELSSSNANSTGGSAILSIGNFSNPYIKVQANEVDITKIQTGQKATITLSAFPSETFAGSIYQVDSVGANSSGVVTYNVYVDFTAATPNIKPGMTASVTIQIARKDDVLMVPSGAVQTSATNGSTVRILTNGQITSIPVEIGMTSDTDTEIISGLSEGQTVVTGITSSASSVSNTSSPFGGTLRGFGGGGAFIRTGGGGGRGGQ